MPEIPRHPDLVSEDLVPLAELPAGDHAIDHEWVAFRELLGSFTRGENAHGALPLQVPEGPNHQERAARVKLLEAGAMGRQMAGRLRVDVGYGFVLVSRRRRQCFAGL